MKTLNYKDLVNLLNDTKGALIIGILAETDCRARKTDNPFGTIFKTVRAVGFCGSDYEVAVKNEGLRQNKQIDFTGEALKWGKWLIPSKVIFHNGEYYLRLQTTIGQRKRQAAKVLGYRAENGRFLSFEQVKPFLPEKRESQKQIDSGLETGTEIMVRTYKFSSIKRIKLLGSTWDLKPNYDTNKIKQVYSSAKPEVRAEKLIENKA